MTNLFNDMTDSMTWAILVGAAKSALAEQGYSIKRVPGRGRSNMWDAEKDGKTERVSIRTTKDRWFAFPPLKDGTRWKTLSDADTVVVAAVDDRDDPNSVDVYRFDAAEVLERFNDAYAARIEADMKVRDNFGMWVNLDEDDRGIAASVGSGLAAENDPIAQYPLSELIESTDPVEAAQEAAADEAEEGRPSTIAEVLDCAREQISALSGMPVSAIKLDCKFEM